MKNNRANYFVFSLFLIITFGSIEINSQEFKILTKTATVEDNKLIVHYDLTESVKNQVFVVWLEVKNSSGEKLQIKSVSGDVGKNISAGKNKKIVWNYIADNIVIDDNIGIEVKAEILSKYKEKGDISLGKAMLLSAVVPGLGITRIKQKKSYLIMSAVTYGTAIMSIVSNKNAYDNYNSYLSDSKISSESESYSKSLSQKNMSNVLMYTAITSWAVNMVWTFVSAKKRDNTTMGFNNKKINFRTGLNPINRAPVFLISYKF